MMIKGAEHILQLTDSVTNRRAALRLEEGDDGFSLGELADKYIKHAPIDRLQRESRITKESADILYSMQDLVYSSSDDGKLRDMFAGVAFKDEGVEGSPVIGPGVRPVCRTAAASGGEICLTDVMIDRIYVFYERNWKGYHARKWAKDSVKYAGYVLKSLEESYGVEEARRVMELSSHADKLRFLKGLAKGVWNGQFENYSRFSGRKLMYKSGDETIDNIMAGAGAICSEKVQALKFLTDHYGFESEYLIAGQDAAGAVPVEKLREILTTFDFRFSRRYSRFWQHTALLYHVNGLEVLVDATNGNIPFLFLEGAEAERVLGYDNKQPVPVKMVEATEQFYYHRVPQDIPQDLFFALEGWISYSDLMQVFNNELGLYLSQDFYVIPIPYRSEKEYQQTRREYMEVADRAGLQCAVTAGWTLETALGEEFQAAEPEVGAKIMETEEHLVRRLDECDGPGHDAGLVIMRLDNFRERAGSGQT